MASHGWRDRAACLGSDPEIWFPYDNDRQAQREAAAICKTICPVQAECLAHAIAVGEQYGIFGGLTASGRAKLRRRQAKTGAAA